MVIGVIAAVTRDGEHISARISGRPLLHYP